MNLTDRKSHWLKPAERLVCLGAARHLCHKGQP